MISSSSSLLDWVKDGVDLGVDATVDRGVVEVRPTRGPFGVAMGQENDTLGHILDERIISTAA